MKALQKDTVHSPPQEQARLFNDIRDSPAHAAQTQARRIIFEAIKDVQDVLQEAQSKLAVISKAYEAGSLPRIEE